LVVKPNRFPAQAGSNAKLAVLEIRFCSGPGPTRVDVTVVISAPPRCSGRVLARPGMTEAARDLCWGPAADAEGSAANFVNSGTV
jgi:hypothetical protein